MECPVCGKFYSVTHDCAGLAPPSLSEKEAAPIPTGFVPLYYLRLAFSIMRWDEISVQRASRDSRALLYGFAFSGLAAMVVVTRMISPLVQSSIQEAQLSESGIFRLLFMVIVVPLALAVVGVVSIVQLGLCHFIAKWFFGAKGTFIRILRPLSLGWPINLLSLIPIAGPILGALLWAAVLMIVFEEVNHILRLQAFAISYGVNILFFAVSRILSA